jgi:DNA-binding NtrC family response regulator
VESEPGKGATFKLYLPACMDELKPKRQTEAREEDIGGSETVLVVEDDDFVRALTCKILKRYGYHALDAGGAESALAVSAGHEGPIGLILTDVVMPGMSAGEMAARIQDVRKETRILFMSGYAGGDIAVYDGMLQPGSPLIEKPFTPAELARKVRDVLDGPIPGRSPV